MKKVFLILSLLLLSLPNLVMAEDPKKEQGPIIIGQENDFPKEPRTPDFGSDITAYYQDGVVYLQFGYDMGEVEISVTNETTGEMWQQTDDSAFGSASIATSASAGSYTISIVTDDGVCYSGSFAL